MRLEKRFVAIEFDDHEAMLYEVKPGWIFIDCAGDVFLQARYWEQSLTSNDISDWKAGDVNEHCRELLADTGVEIENVQIKYSHEHRKYEVEISERVETSKSQKVKSTNVANSAGLFPAYRMSRSNRVGVNFRNFYS